MAMDGRSDGVAVELLSAELGEVQRIRDETRGSLRLWRFVYYSLGTAAVVSTAIAGASSLAEFWGHTAAGVLALAAVALTATEKFIGAGDKVARLERRFGELAGLHDAIAIDVHFVPAVADVGTWARDHYAATRQRLEEIDAAPNRV